MLFDLRGHRRRAVQATYLILAVLMGGGLVLFGIGSSAPQGLVDAITGNSSGGSDVNEQLQKRIDRQKERLQASPSSTTVLAELVRLNYQAAVSQQPSGTTTFPEDAKDELRAAGVYYDRYVEATNGEPSGDLARFAYTIYGPTGLNDADKAKEAVRVLAAKANDTQTYLLLVQAATAAGDKRTAQLAGQKAVDLAPKGRRKEVEKAIKTLQTQVQAGTPQGQ